MEDTMARSTCVKCGNGRFEIVETPVIGSEYRLTFVQCQSCGGVVGVTEYYNIGARLEILAKKIGVKLPA
jgi:hypothetical protein